MVVPFPWSGIRTGRRSATAAVGLERTCGEEAIHRACENHRRIVRTDGGLAGPSRWARRSSAITVAGGSPDANRRSASRRSIGHECDPGFPCPSIAACSRCTWATSAARRRAPNTPEATHIAPSRSAKSRPPCLRMNASLPWASHSHIQIPWVRNRTLLGVRPPCAQIAHGGHPTCCAPSIRLNPRRPPMPTSFPTDVLQRYTHLCQSRHDSHTRM